MSDPKITSDTILEYMTSLVEQKKSIPREVWLEVAFKLNLLSLDEARLLEKMRQAVALKTLEILKAQEKRNVSAADLETRASDEYRFMREQEAKVDTINQFVMIAKKNSDSAY